MGLLKKCPECNNVFHNDTRNVQLCKVCGYWTKKNTVNMDFVMMC
ncbi:MAG: hypothetical protein RBT65_03545 [Methanolobus sp.]|nr:hypothetical protein [Methanolobus sp.]